MRKVSGAAWAAIALAGVLAVAPGAAQDTRSTTDDPWCDQEWRGSRDTERHCEVREVRIPAGRERIVVDGGMNGGIRVSGWDENAILVRAKVVTNSRREEDARAMAGEIRVVTDRAIRAEGPSARNGRHEWWAVSFEVFVPRASNLDLETHNGGISVEDVRGDIDFEALNGGVSLARVAGDVSGGTTNGGLKVELDGNRWQGAGLDARTINGGVTLEVPSDFSAELETGTVNGRIDIDFPVTVQGRIGRSLRTTLGEGGPMIRAVTTNGGVHIRRR